ncbi:MAG: methyltransferase domain-containing protein [Geminicoccaceae bacterium]
MVLADGHALPFEAEFDAVFSNAALHWMTRPDDVIAGVARPFGPADGSSPSSAAWAMWPPSPPPCAPCWARPASTPSPCGPGISRARTSTPPGSNGRVSASRRSS